MNFILFSSLLMFALANAIPHDVLTKPLSSQPLHLLSAEKPVKRPLKKETDILNGGKLLSEAITAKIVGPVVIFNSKVAAAAGALPPLLAAKGAVIGAAIATPIEVGAVAASSITSGVTGKLVAIPISLASGAIAKLVGIVETGKEVWEDSVEDGKKVVENGKEALKKGQQLFKNGAIKLGHIVFKPIAVIFGAKTALAGAGLGLAGAKIKGVGVGVEAVGGKMVLTGLKAKAIGARLIKGF